VFSVIKISVDQWHNHLGHPSHEIVHHVISKNNLSCAHLDSLGVFVCDDYACAKVTNYPILCHLVALLLL
jgi:hypothetical protein